MQAIGDQQTNYYRWGTKYDGTNLQTVKQFREMQKQNSRLKKVADELALDGHRKVMS